mmetsp:Transcript_70969/g.229775  ORF Transcript_70969/g.229775 Transcript_70969/m.229775 type:complete len:616 (+) Transcript_70969:62-1909(+)
MCQGLWSPILALALALSLAAAEPVPSQDSYVRLSGSSEERLEPTLLLSSDSLRQFEADMLRRHSAMQREALEMIKARAAKSRKALDEAKARVNSAVQIVKEELSERAKGLQRQWEQLAVAANHDKFGKCCCDIGNACLWMPFKRSREFADMECPTGTTDYVDRVRPEEDVTMTKSLEVDGLLGKCVDSAGWKEQTANDMELEGSQAAKDTRIQEPSEMPTKQPAQSTELPTQEPLDSEVQSLTTTASVLLTQQQTEQPTERPAEDLPVPTQEPDQQLEDESNEQPTKTMEPLVQATEQPTQEPEERFSELPTKDPTEQLAQEPTLQPTEQLEGLTEPTKQPTDPPQDVTEQMEQLAGQPTEQPTKQPTEQPMEQPTEKPTEEPMEQPKDAVQSVEKPTESPTFSELVLTSTTPAAGDGRQGSKQDMGAFANNQNIGAVVLPGLEDTLRKDEDFPTPTRPPRIGPNGNFVAFLFDKACDGASLQGRHGNKPRGIMQSQVACENACAEDPACNFYLWKDEPRTHRRYHCATFAACDEYHTYHDGVTATIYKRATPTEDDAGSWLEADAGMNELREVTEQEPASPSWQLSARHFQAHGAEARGEAGAAARGGASAKQL